MTCKDARIHMMSALRLAAEPKNKKPDPDLDVSTEAVLASMELGVKSSPFNLDHKWLSGPK